MKGLKNKDHPVIKKFRDELANGTIDLAQVPIAEMDPEDIKVIFLVHHLLKFIVGYS